MSRGLHLLMRSPARVGILLGSKSTGRAALLLGLMATSAAVLGWPDKCRAFSDPDQFAAKVENGGGGGRYFTGSRADGYGCGVCHRGGVAPVLQINGLPINGYQPGTTYEIEVTWSTPGKLSHGLNLELLGRDGTVPGLVALPDKSQVGVAGRCGGVPTGDVAAFERMVGKRKVLGVEACDAQSLRFRFTPANVPELDFSVSAMTSDKTASIEKDGVTNLRRVLRRVGEPAKTGADCSLAAGRQPASTRFPAVLSLLALGLALSRFAGALRSRR
jgi:hypothetical protein